MSGSDDFRERFGDIERILEQLAAAIGKDVRDIESATDYFVGSLADNDIDLDTLAAFLVEKFFRKILELRQEPKLSGLDSEGFIKYLLE